MSELNSKRDLIDMFLRKWTGLGIHGHDQKTVKRLERFINQHVSRGAADHQWQITEFQKKRDAISKKYHGPGKYTKEQWYKRLVKADQELDLLKMLDKLHPGFKANPSYGYGAHENPRKNHKWSDWKSTGHGSGDGTPAGVVSIRTCKVCRAQEWRDSAVSDRHGNPHPARGFRDSYGHDTDTRPECLGYDPLDNEG